jgi:hypothetical protein
VGVKTVGDMSIYKIENTDLKDGYDGEGKIYSHVFRLGGIYGPVCIYIYIYMYIYLYVLIHIYKF